MNSFVTQSLILFTTLCAAQSFAEGTKPYEVHTYDHLLGKSPGLDDALLKMHFQLYQGYVNNTNKLLGMIAELDKTGNNRGPEFAELKRRFGWEFDGMRLHELYFDNLGGAGQKSETSEFAKAVTADFGSFDAWKEDFVATGLMRGIGWVVTTRDPFTGRLINLWVNEHDVGHLTTASPLLIMDVFEHAYITEYGLNRADYIKAFFNNINWQKVDERLSKAQGA
jgi:Superoxide dismutase